MLRHAQVTEQIIQAYYRVYGVLGYGFLEKVYQNAMLLELRARGLNVEPQAEFKVQYEGEVGGEYYADLFVEGKVIVELKAVEALAEEHHAQVINYLKASGIEIGLLMNFGPKPEFKHKIWDHTDSLPSV